MNASIHFIAGMCTAFFTLAAAFLAPEGYFSQTQLFFWVTIGLFIVAVEYVAAIKQWRWPPSGRDLSLTLHLLFAITVIAMISYELWKTRPTSIISWFLAKQFGSVTVLASIRICAGTFLLISKLKRNSMGNISSKRALQ